MAHGSRMTKRRQVTCDDCYFRHADLCALPGNEPCPTFRAAAEHRLAPPRQAPLVPRDLRVAAASRAA